jgi:DnaJ domain
MKAPADILGLPPGASRTEARQAFQRYALEHHPDRGGDPERFREGKSAYEAFVVCRATAGRAPSNVAFVRRRTVRRRLAAALRDLTGHRHSNGSQPKRRTRRW